MKTLRILLTLLLLPFLAFSQTLSTNTNAWLHYMGTFALNSKESLSLESSLRGANVIQDFQQFFIRPMYDYKVRHNLTTSVGYTFAQTGVYGDPALNKITSPEHQAFVQGNLVIKKNKWNITQRLRNENRWVGIATPTGSDKYEISEHAYRNRMRYMFIFNYPLATVGQTQSINALLGNELFVNIGKNAGKTLINQNRAIAGLAYRFSPKHQIQLAYIHQHIWNTPNTILESNKTVRLSYVSQLKLYKEPKLSLDPSKQLMALN